MRHIHLIIAAIAALMYGGIHLSLIVVHVTTTYFSWVISDSVIVAIVTFFTPPLSVFWWAFSTWMQTGVFLNFFTMMIAGVIALYLVQLAFVVLMVLTEPKVGPNPDRK